MYLLFCEWATLELNQPTLTPIRKISMLKSFESMTLQEKRAIEFGKYLISNGYGYTIRIPSRQLAKELTAKGKPISFITIIGYFRSLVKMGYCSSEMHCKLWGVKYTLNRYAFEKLNEQKQIS